MLRLRVSLKRLQLDSALASGAHPAASDELELRALQLAEPSTRERLAASIDRLLERVDRAPEEELGITHVPLRRARIQAVRPQLLELAVRLRDSGPHRLRGLAMVSVLLENGSSPLYFRGASGRLEDRIRAALTALAA